MHCYSQFTIIFSGGMNSLSIYCAECYLVQDPDHQNLLCSHGITDVLCQCVHSTTPKVNRILWIMVKRLFLIRYSCVGDPCRPAVSVVSGLWEQGSCHHDGWRYEWLLPWHQSSHHAKLDVQLYQWFCSFRTRVHSVYNSYWFCSMFAASYNGNQLVTVLTKILSSNHGNETKLASARW